MTESEKKEKMNELMNRISFALKDDILAQGFEIICNSFSSFEKENEELKTQIEKYKEKFIKEIAEHNKEIAELKKLFNEEHQRFNKYLEETLFLRGENEELKAQIEKMKRCNNCKFEEYQKYHGEKCNFGNYKTCGNWELADEECAKQNENKITPTFNIRISDVCRAGIERK